jgi:putative intracellular protease/amidase
VIDIAIPIFDGFTALEAIGPYEVLSRVPGAGVRFLAAEPGPKRSDMGMVGVTADFALSDLEDPEVIVIPGGLGITEMIADPLVLAWLRRAHDTTFWTAAVSTGTLLLAAAGVAERSGPASRPNQLANCTRGERNRLTRRHGMDRGKVLTAAGAATGIEMALRLAAALAGEKTARAIQDAIGYNPERTPAIQDAIGYDPERADAAAVRQGRPKLGAGRA